MKKIYIVTDGDGERIAFGSRTSAEGFLNRHPESLDTYIEVIPYYDTHKAYQEEEL